MVKEQRMESDIATAAFRRKKVMTLPQLTHMLGCSERTTKRRIKEWRTYNSYNCNGRYYALPDTPRFNEKGLWHYRDTRFSIHGNLRETVVYLVNHSDAGFSGRELEEDLGLKKDSCLSYFRSIDQLRIEKLGNRHIYFSLVGDAYKKQKAQQLHRIERTCLSKLPSSADAVLILVEAIKCPGLTIEKLAEQLRRKGYLFGIESIRHLFSHHGLVKKTEHIEP